MALPLLGLGALARLAPAVINFGRGFTGMAGWAGLGSRAAMAGASASRIITPLTAGLTIAEIGKSFFGGAARGIVPGAGLGGLGGDGGQQNLAGTQQSGTQQPPPPPPTNDTGQSSGGSRRRGVDPYRNNSSCCPETIALLESIDATLKKNLRLSVSIASSNAVLQNQIRENAAEGTPGLGGRQEAIKDKAEQLGYGLGEAVLTGIIAQIMANLGNPAALTGTGIGALGGALLGKTPLGKIGLTIAGAGLGNIAGGLTGNMFSGRAEGGPTRANKPYIIGEKGPEIFVPKTDGTVIPNDEMLNFFRKEKMAETRTSYITDAMIRAIFSDMGEVFGESAAKQMKINMEKSTGGFTFAPPGRAKIDRPPMSDNMRSNFTPNSLFDFVAQYESGNDPNIYNKYDPATNTYKAVRGENITQLSVDDVLQKQNVKTNGKSTNMFAAGSVQYTPETLSALVKKMKEEGLLTGEEKFTEELQKTIFQYQINTDSKFKNLRAFLAGNTDPAVKEAAMLELAREWRALPDPRTGMTYGDSGASYNRSLVSVGDVSSVLEAERTKQNPANQIKGLVDSLFSGLSGPQNKNTDYMQQNALQAQKDKPQLAMASQAPQTVVVNSGGQSMPYVGQVLPADGGPTLPAAVSQFG